MLQLQGNLARFLLYAGMNMPWLCFRSQGSSLPHIYVNVDVLSMTGKLVRAVIRFARLSDRPDRDARDRLRTLKTQLYALVARGCVDDVCWRPPLFASAEDVVPSRAAPAAMGQVRHPCSTRKG